jgi:hypothetical protein
VTKVFIMMIVWKGNEYIQREWIMKCVTATGWDNWSESVDLNEIRTKMSKIENEMEIKCGGGQSYSAANENFSRRVSGVVM